MRKLVTTAALLAPAAAFFGSLYATYRLVFYSPNDRQNDDHAIAHTSQMDVFREQISEMIDAADAVPYEPVEIRSHDGLVLRARYYHQSDDCLDWIRWAQGRFGEDKPIFLVDEPRYEKIVLGFVDRVRGE